MNAWLIATLLTLGLAPLGTVSAGEKPSEQAPYPHCQSFFATVCEASWPSIDPTGEVDYAIRAELLALRMMGNILQKGPELSSREVKRSLMKKIYTPAKRRDIQEVFKLVKSVMMDKVETLVDHENDKGLSDFLKARLERVILKLPPEDVARAGDDDVDILTNNSLYYERTPSGLMHIRIGGAYLLGHTSWFNRSYSLAHELAHAIDPCELKLMRIQSSSYNIHQGCFVKQGWLEKERMNCSSHGHLSEVFADWMAAHVQMEILKLKTPSFTSEEVFASVRNSVKDLCKQKASVGRLIFDQHPTPEVRIEKIFGGHPDLEGMKSCKPVEKKRRSYCPLNPQRAES